MIKISGNIIAEIVGGYGIRAQDFQIGQLQKKVDILEKYEAFEAAHANDFTEIISVGSQLESALSELGKAKQFNVQTGMYNSPDFTSSQWYNDLVAYNQKSPSRRVEVVSTDVDGYYKVYVNGHYNEQATANYMFMISKDGMKQLGIMGVTMAGEMTGAYSIYRLFTGKDPVTGDEVSRLEAALWTTVLLVSQAGLITMARELRAGNRLLSGAQLSAKDLALLTKAGYFEDVAKISIIEELSDYERIKQKTGLDKTQIDDFLSRKKMTPEELSTNLKNSTWEEFLINSNGKTRLPKTNGKWEGVPEESNWFSQNPKVQSVTNGVGVEFTNGRPKFSPWKKGEITFKPGVLNGTDADFNAVYDKIKELKGFSSRNQVKNWLREVGLTPHHSNSTTIELIPTDLHGNIPHIGTASDLRGGN